MTELSYINWHKSSRSSGGGNCVEVGNTADNSDVGVRDTKDRLGGTLSFSRAAWAAFIAGTKDGEFDLR